MTVTPLFWTHAVM